MITIIDYGMGNLGSVQNMIKKVGGKSNITNAASDILNAEKLILPGVGSFDQAMFNLKSLGLIDAIKQKVNEGTSLLGICLGMQLLANRSEEGILDGLGLIEGNVIKFPVEKNTKIPHMGWNVVNYKSENGLYKDFELFEETRFYFVHSYYFKCKNEQNEIGITPFGINFCSSVANKNVYGVQFHPEKSHKYGMQLMHNFIHIS
jgi:glutamine amidotransferase